jgi:hypothetical protein
MSTAEDNLPQELPVDNAYLSVNPKNGNVAIITGDLGLAPDTETVVRIDGLRTIVSQHGKDFIDLVLPAGLAEALRDAPEVFLIESLPVEGDPDDSDQKVHRNVKKVAD